MRTLRFSSGSMVPSAQRPGRLDADVGGDCGVGCADMDHPGPVVNRPGSRYPMGELVAGDSPPGSWTVASIDDQPRSRTRVRDIQQLLQPAHHKAMRP